MMVAPSRRPRLRAVAVLLLPALLVVPLTAGHGRAASKIYRIGFLGTTSPRSHGAFLDAFNEGLREHGYVEGKNVAIEVRWAENDYSRLPALAAELVRLKVDLLLTHGTPGTRAAKEATSTIPIVVTILGDAVATGLVASLARPGGNITGSTFFFAEVNAKRFEILKEALPTLKRVAVLLNDDNRGNVVTFEAVAKTARSINIDAFPVSARDLDSLGGAFAQIARSGAQAAIVFEDPLFIAEAARLATLAERQRLPSIGFREYAEAGGLLGFGVDFPDVWRRAAGIADRILKGARPADIPMQQPAKYDTIVNLRTAKALRLTIPPRVLQRASTVIEP